MLDVQAVSVQTLMPLPRPHDAWGRTIALSADGTTLVYLQSQAEGDVWMMTVPKSYCMEVTGQSGDRP